MSRRSWQAYATGAAYRFVDRSAGPGPSRYRLQAVGVDGNRRWYPGIARVG